MGDGKHGTQIISLTKRRQMYEVHAQSRAPDKNIVPFVKGVHTQHNRKTEAKGKVIIN